MSLTVNMTKDGLVPTPSSELRASIVSTAESLSPGLTADLPGSLIEDIASTDVGAATLIDQALVDLVNSVSPFAANEFILNQLGQMYGIKRSEPVNASVYVQFTGAVGFVIQPGFLVSDGTNQFYVKNGGVIASGGTVTLFCIASNSGTFPIPANTVTQLITSAPLSAGLSCTNPDAGTQQTTEESIDNYRARVLQAGLSPATGMASQLKTSLRSVTGVEYRLVAISKVSGGWKIMVGGNGDPYSIGYQIYYALFDFFNIQGSATPSRNVTVTINEFPDYYDITYIRPVNQLVSLNVTWNTTLTNYISESSIVSLSTQALSNYINSIQVGQPINVFELNKVFQDSVSSIIDPAYITRLIFNVYINSVLTPPASGTGLVSGDSEGYFTTGTTSIVINRG